MPVRNNVHVWAGVSKQTDLQLTRWATRLGMSKSMLINLCVQAGLGQVVRAVAPEEAFDPKQWAAIFKEMGKSVKAPRGARVPAKRVK